MTWSVITPDGAEGTTAAMVEKPCIVELGRIIATFDRVDDALKAASAVNATEDALAALRERIVERRDGHLTIRPDCDGAWNSALHLVDVAIAAAKLADR